MSTSSLDGGNIGWISSKSLSEKILAILDKMKVGDVSKPIIETNTATIIKLLDKKTLNLNNIDLNELRKKIIKNKKNELLNLYSNNYLSKIKNNALIEMK
jgi:parvulin-like peptidyl-prolyl isomerase